MIESDGLDFDKDVSAARSGPFDRRVDEAQDFGRKAFGDLDPFLLFLGDAHGDCRSSRLRVR